MKTRKEVELGQNSFSRITIFSSNEEMTIRVLIPEIQAEKPIQEMDAPSRFAMCVIALAERRNEDLLKAVYERLLMDIS